MTIMKHLPYRAEIALPGGERATVRTLCAEDVEMLAAFFLGLSEQTRSTYGPHPFDRRTAEQLCADIAEDAALRFLAVRRDGTADTEIIGYMILDLKIREGDLARLGDKLQPDARACLAPVIADAYQGKGIGMQMAQCVLEAARAMGLRQVVLMGGVLADNPRARRLYERLGFRYVGEFWSAGPPRRLNYDMILDLA